ncbi:hypothetical protein [Shewanella sp. Shew256]|uniref:hypothetical protein n=1 Tax=Shewanella sp. Shew256 TaxID=1969376 RepID=UPI000B497EAF|nr:hypothetical protein [Shewanella sp. Shew256]
MRYILTLIFILIISGTVFADESVKIFVKESGYSINISDEELNSAELESKLKQLKFSLVTLEVDYCAGPVMVAEVYVTLANANPTVQDVRLKTSGSHEKSKCKSVY